jgi:tripartite-type tricarboxylate transporter receptor subunit TctC
MARPAPIPASTSPSSCSSGRPVPISFTSPTVAAPRRWSISSLDRFRSSGRLIALGLSDGKRFPAAPEIPTIAESGVPGFGRASGFIGLFAPAGTPAPIIKKLSREVAAILATPNAQATARTLTAAIAYQDDEAFGRFLAGESVNWKQALSSLDLAH